ncbi:MAG: PhnD/SsuA/transferrin family substrate-binding protein [Nitrososphaerota archaeon]
MDGTGMETTKLNILLNLALIATLLSIVILTNPYHCDEIVVINLGEKTTYPSLNISSKKVIYFGFDPRLDPDTEIQIYAPLMSYLSDKTGYEFRLKYEPTYELVQNDIGMNVTQFAAVGPVSYIVTGLRYGNVIPVTVGLDENKSMFYRAVIFTRTDLNITSLAELKGKSFAFGSYYSTQGHLIPLIMLEEAGVSLKDFREYAFLGSHQQCAEAVISGRFDAGAMQDLLAFRLAREGLIKIIAISKPFPRSLIIANKAVDNNLVENVKKALIELEPLGSHSTLTLWSMTEFPGGFAEPTIEYYAIYYELVEKYLLSGESK